MKIRRYPILRAASLGLVLAVGGGAALADGLVDSIVKAPIVPDGDVAGAVTDLVINLAIDPDPAVPGLDLGVGETIAVTLPDGFVHADPEGSPVMDFLGGPDCGLVRPTCSTAVLLQGWPQNPVLPSFPPGETPAYTISYDEARNRIALRIRQALDKVPLPGPGVKQIHLLLLGFRNPTAPGYYPIHVAIHGTDERQRRAGTGMVMIRRTGAPSLGVISIFDENGAEPPNTNTIFQTAQPGERTPLPWSFLAWDAEGNALDGLVAEQTGASEGALLRHGEVIGRYMIEAPTGAAGHRLDADPSVALESEPVFGLPFPTGHFTAHFTAGSKPGHYRTTLQLDGGDPVVMHVDARD